jgi:Holliday junction DNA helicase RuvB
MTIKNFFRSFENQENGEKHSFVFDKSNEYLYDYIPKSFSDYHGQAVLKSRLQMHINSAKKRDCPIDHILLFGPPGLGKTTLAKLIAKEMGAKIRITTGPTIQKNGDLVSLLSQLKEKDVLFIDEIHRLPITVEEILYGAMEGFKVDIILGQGHSSKIVTLDIKPFTLIGATTKAGTLSSPLRSRFGIIEKLDWYNANDLSEIIRQSAEFYGIKIMDDDLILIASRSRGTPRVAKKLMKKITDYFVTKENMSPNKNEIIQAMEFFGIYENGLTELDFEILKILKSRTVENPIGIEALSNLIGEDCDTLEDIYEPFLLQQGYVERTPRGRVLGIKN